MRSVLLKTGSLTCAIGVAALMLTADAATAQFFPFFGQPQQQPQRQAPPPPPQQARPSQQPAQAPARKAAQPPAQQKASAPAQQGPKAAPGTTAAPFGEVRTACSTEIRSTCAGVVPGSADSVQCLQRNFAVHSEPCQAALTRAGNVAAQPAAPAQAGKPDQPAGTATAPRIVSTDRVTQPEAAKEALAPDLKLPAMRPTQEARWVNRYCREDHSLLCQGVTFGQSRVLKCLLSHQSSLKNDCKQALAKR
jgi:hypothetical protein